MNTPATRAPRYITTPSGIRIGSAWQRPPSPRFSADACRLQSALLAARMPRRLPWWQRAALAFWNWC